MVLTKHRPRHDEAALLDATVHAVPVVRPRGVAPAPLAGRPGIAAEVLRELRAADAPVPPTALRRAFDRPAGTWLPVVGLRAVPVQRVVVDDLDTVLADIRAAVAAAPHVRHEPAFLMAIAPIAEQLAEVAAR